jgi:hypothetical protein
MINPLPWKFSKSISGEQKYNVIFDVNDKECVLHVNDYELSDENAEYIIKACNMFPEVVEALRMVLHDTMNGHLSDKAEEIMCRAYSVLNKNNIKVPNFYDKQNI